MQQSDCQNTQLYQLIRPKGEPAPIGRNSLMQAPFLIFNIRAAVRNRSLLVLVNVHVMSVRPRRGRVSSKQAECLRCRCVDATLASSLPALPAASIFTRQVPMPLCRGA